MARSTTASSSTSSPGTPARAASSRSSSNGSREIRNELGTDQVFDVVGEIFPANLLDKLFRDLYARRTNEHAITDRIVEAIDPDRFRQITESALEGLAKRELNLSAIVGKSVEARERRLVPEAIENFFVEAAPETGVHPQEAGKDSHVYRIGKLPRTLIQRGNTLEHRFGKLGRDYGRVAFDKEFLKKDPTLEWVTPGHPLFEAVRDEALDRVHDDLKKGAIFFDIQRKAPALLDVFAASVKDGRGRTLHRRLFVVETDASSQMAVRQPTIFHEITPAPKNTKPVSTDELPIPARNKVEHFLFEQALSPWLAENAAQRATEIAKVARHVEISLNALIDRAQVQYAQYESRRLDGQNVPGLEGLICQAEQHLDELNNRLDSRRRELDQERHCTIGDISHLGRAMVLPHPERQTPQIAPMVRDDEVEKLAVKIATEHEEARGFVVESVESENRGFDLISPEAAPRGPEDVRRGPLHRGEGPGRRRGNLPECQRVSGRGAAEGRLLALRGLQLRVEAGAAHHPEPGEARLAAGDEGRAIQGQAECREGSG